MALTGCKGPRRECFVAASSRNPEGPAPDQAPRVLVLIATAYGRTGWLVDRALRSVYAQADCDSRLVHVLIVDGNEPVAGDGASGRLAGLQGAYSGHRGQPFRSKPDTDSGASRTSVPEHRDHPVR